jgi:hypothetical protein
VILPLLLAGHLIGDWVFQTDYEALNKTTSWRANQAHMFTYHLALTLFAVWTLGWTMILVLIVSWVTHSIIDRRWPVKWLMRHTGSGPFSNTLWGVICVDQALHISILCVCAALLGG